MSVNFTSDQLRAIEANGSDVLVSAAAGSGKTAVLTERIVQKLLNNTDINDLIVLTFTNASAKDMKDKIYNAVSIYPELEEQLIKIPTADIMTFDAYALNLLKKYHYLLGLKQTISIGESTIFEYKMEEILNEYIEINKDNHDFINFLNTYNLLDKKGFVKDIMSFYRSLSLYLNIDLEIGSFNQSKAEKVYIELQDYALRIVSSINENLQELSNYCVDKAGEKHYESVINNLNSIHECSSYEEIADNISLSRKKDGSKSKKMENIEEINRLTAVNNDLLKKLTDICIVRNKDDFTTNYLHSQDNSVILKDIINYLHNNLMAFKIEKSIFEFVDIKRLSIRLLEENKFIRNDILNNTSEILLDEYQDTDDIQEYFVSLISKNNVYMVGDIKQAIYGFRNANPEIFIDKYNRYNNSDDGELISLNKNFRSNKQVITGINEIFNELMDEEIGGVKYDDLQKLVYGNTNYDLQNIDNNYNLELYNYTKIKGQNKDVLEAIIIARDIIDKVTNGFEVIKKNKNKKVTYSDFVILTRTKSCYEIYNKVFEAFNIPLKSQTELSFKENYDIMVLSNLTTLINNLNRYGDYRHELMSVTRSFLFDYKDSDIDLLIKNYNYGITLLDNLNDYPQFEEFRDNLIEFNNQINVASIYTLVMLIVSSVDFLKHSTEIEGGELSFERILKILEIAKQFDNMNYTFEMFCNHLTKIKYSYNNDIDFNIDIEATDSVNLMTEHKSKGLEFPIVYISKLDSKFKFDDAKNTFNYDEDYGMYHSYLQELYKNKPVVGSLIKIKNIRKVISEELRLFYVALTRAESKLILVGDFNDMRQVNNIEENRENAKSILDLLNLLKPVLEKYISPISVTEEEIISVNEESQTIDSLISNQQIITKEYKLDYQLTQKRRASKEVKELFDLKTINAIKYGDELHHFLEFIDFKNPQYELLNEQETEIVNNLLKYDIITDNINMFSEYEFIDQELTGIIDLLIERENEFIILDYKTSNIDDDDYLKQLNTYKDYLQTKTDKDIKICLYSLLQDELRFF